MYVRSKREWTLLVVALGCTVGLEGVWAVRQHFLMDVGRAQGSLDHANSLSMYLCMTVPLLVAVACSGWARWLRWFCMLCSALGAVGLVLTYSRAGIPIFAVVVIGTFLTCTSWRLSLRRIATLLILVLGVVVLVAASWSRMEQRYAEAT